MLPDEIKPAMQGVIPSHIVTCSRDGIPNASVISQVYYVDPDHVALSHQFFNKTTSNVRENPHAVACITHPETLETWDLELEYDHSETTGPVFDTMDMQIEAIASMTGMKGIFKLRSADIYRVVSVIKNADERIQP
ncbi:MAG: pyridoxamine 5'-phosphate oxidase family protein [Candidatus Binatia bacterium]